MSYYGLKRIFRFYISVYRDFDTTLGILATVTDILLIWTPNFDRMCLIDYILKSQNAAPSTQKNFRKEGTGWQKTKNFVGAKKFDPKFRAKY